ncbi:MAG: hypothetical protein RLZZ480_795 [Candidatus Parcubacteria bacterium]|jgi:Tfp pilus assembly protein PilX
MATNPTVHKPDRAGFALLMALIVVSVVVTIGLSVLDLSLKQVRLSTNAKDSEIAFHAANAGMECARYWRRVDATVMENGGTINPSCFSGTATVDPVLAIVNDSDKKAFLYKYSITWQGSDRCSQITTLVASSTASSAGVTVSNMKTLIKGYPTDTKVCSAGTRCSVLSVRGYNKPCGSVSEYGTVEREVLLQF